MLACKYLGETLNEVLYTFSYIFSSETAPRIYSFIFKSEKTDLLTARVSLVFSSMDVIDGAVTIAKESNNIL